ncbi:MAG: galactokinase [Petroclostridium sp.]|nr:galactokinase [Clostridia bacterium]MDK2810596.1 galactokinase [Petroclostridium sp.]
MEIKDLKKRFVEIYGGAEEDLRVFASPGRVNLIGEHTDYNGGYVFPAALTMKTTIIARPRKDREIHLAATDLECRVKASLDQLEQYKKLEWGNYQLGVADELQKAGYQLTGCELLYDDTVPHGGGLSSSAAIEVATALTLVTLGNEANGINKEVDMVEMAKIGQKAENNYVGVNCGIMDQFASAMGKANHAIFLDCKDLSYKLVPLNLKGYKIVISNTNKKRSLAHSKYNERRSECERGLEILKNVLPEASCLGEISYEQFKQYKHLIEDEVVRKRVEHVISEDDRVLKSVEALNKDDIAEFGKLMIASHNSLRDLYEVTGVELDTLVEEALKIEGVIGSRMTGAGFGGCTVSIVKEEAVEKFIEQVGKNYFERVGLQASFYVSEVGDGGKEIK